MKTSNQNETQSEINQEMMAAVSKLTTAASLLLIIIAILFWQNYSALFGKKANTSAVNTASVALPILSDKAQKGKLVFQNNCAACHNKNMRTDLTGPALGGVSTRWAAYPREDLYQWIRNSQAMIQGKHPRALELWTKWNPRIMTSFNSISDVEIDAILAYVDEVYAEH